MPFAFTANKAPQKGALFPYSHVRAWSRQSRDPRNALRLSEDDRRKNNTIIVGLDPRI